MHESNRELPKEDSEFLFDAVLEFFFHVPKTRPLERELRRIHPQKLGIPQVDMQRTEEFHELISSEIYFLMQGYLAAMKEAETQPLASSIALHVVWRGLKLGRKDFETWLSTPQDEFAGMLPREFLELKGLRKLADQLLR